MKDFQHYGLYTNTSLNEIYHLLSNELPSFSKTIKIGGSQDLQSIDVDTSLIRDTDQSKILYWSTCHWSYTNSNTLPNKLFSEKVLEKIALNTLSISDLKVLKKYLKFKAGMSQISVTTSRKIALVNEMGKNITFVAKDMGKRPWSERDLKMAFRGVTYFRYSPSQAHHVSKIITGMLNEI